MGTPELILIFLLYYIINPSSQTWSRSPKMKIVLGLVGLILILAMFSTAAEDQEISFSEDIVQNRVGRDAVAARIGEKKSGKGKGRARRRKDKRKKKRNGKKKKMKKMKKEFKKNRKHNTNGNPIRRKKKRKSRKNKKIDRSTAIDAKCVSQVSVKVRRWQELAKNFDRAYKQMKLSRERGPGKNDKKGIFAPVAMKLVSVGAGNKSALECGGQAGTEGAKQLMNLTTLMEGCEKSVNDSCNLANFPAANMTKLDDCKSKVEKYSNMSLECFKKSRNESTAADGCACWCDEAITSLFDEIANCSKDANTDKEAANSQLKKCKKAFSNCKKYQDDAVDTLSACSASVDKLKEKAAGLSKNAAAVKAAQEKVKSLIDAASRRHRSFRATAVTCTEVITKVKTLITIVSENPSSPQVYIIATEITSSTVTCTEDEKQSLRDEDALEAAQDDLAAATGTTASSAELSSVAAAVSSTKSARMRFRLKNQFKNA